MYVVSEALENAQIVTGGQNLALEWNTQVTFNPKTLRQDA